VSKWRKLPTLLLQDKVNICHTEPQCIDWMQVERKWSEEPPSKIMEPRKKASELS